VTRLSSVSVCNTTASQQNTTIFLFLFLLQVPDTDIVPFELFSVQLSVVKHSA